MSAALSRFISGNTGPILVVTLVLVAIWYGAAIFMNAGLVGDQAKRAGESLSATAFIERTWSLERPRLPAPHQVFTELKKSTVDRKVTSKRSLIWHAWITLAPTLLGFFIGTALGMTLAIGIVHVETLNKSLLPWIIASQTVPILAIAPMIIVVLGNIGLTGLFPKALISTYLCFFPVAIGMVKGLRSPDVLQRDLMRTYCASEAQVFWKLRLPSSLPFLFASLKVAVAISLIGAIVGELPSGATAGLGARLLVGSYYGQTIQIWAALLFAAALAACLVFAVSLAERQVLKQWGLA